MALTREQVNMMAKIAYRDAKPKREAAPPKTDDELLTMKWADLTPQQQGRVMTLLQDRLKPRP